MRTPEGLEPLVDCGVIDEVLRPLMSGKEAQVYVVLAGGKECVAKVYKEASQRTFKHRADYTEGRRSRNTRDQRAVTKRTRHGRQQDEAAWRNTEVEMIFRLRDAGVRVPEPINYLDGVLVMELVQDAEGNPAPRLGDLEFEAGEAEEIYQQLIREVVRMLCAGVIHGDLSDFNVLMSATGPVLIDFPQSVDPAHNRNARKLLLRDVENLHRFVSNFSSRQSTRPYAEEMWELYESNRLAADTELTGGYRAPEVAADTDEVLALIEEANLEERGRRAGRFEDFDIESASGATDGPTDGPTPKPIFKPLRAVVDFSAEIRPRPGRGIPAEKPPGKEAGGAAPKKRRGRRRSPAGPPAGSQSKSENPQKTTTDATRTPARPRRRNTSASQTDADRKNTAPRESEAPKKRRRRGRGRARSKTEDTGTGAKAGSRASGKAGSDAVGRGGAGRATTAGANAGGRVGTKTGSKTGSNPRTTARNPRATESANRPAKPKAGQTARRGQGKPDGAKSGEAPRRRRRRRPRTEGS